MNRNLMETETMPTAQSSLIVEVCRRLYARNCLAAADGNVSVRLDDGRILITPSGVSKAFIKADEMAEINVDGEILRGHPSSERQMHLEIYRRCAKARAVVHAHPPHAIAWSLARPDLKELPCEQLGEVILGAGSIPFVPYSRPGTAAMGEVLVPYLPHQRALILRRHGAVCWGEDLHEALNGMERIEHSAQILMLSERMGGGQPLPAEEIAALRAIRAKLGERLL